MTSYESLNNLTLKKLTLRFAKAKKSFDLFNCVIPLLSGVNELTQRLIDTKVN